QLFERDIDTVHFGIFSRYALDEQVVRDTLGDASEIVLLSSYELEDRINELYIDTKLKVESNPY
ncbi:MAG: hypothetical protein JXQ76_00530, partial [Campylobacterales bacterium]|nr:hypothetical protein [Campylobacterales bacterium]